MPVYSYTIHMRVGRTDRIQRRDDGREQVMGEGIEGRGNGEGIEGRSDGEGIEGRGDGGGYRGKGRWAVYGGKKI